MDQSQSAQNNSLDTFIDQLIEEKGFPDLSDDVRVEIKKDLLERVDSFISAKLIAALSDDDVASFEKLLQEGKSQDELQQFIQAHVQDPTTLVTQALTEFKGVYLGTIPTA